MNYFKIDPYRLQILPDGELKRGNYYYRVVADVGDTKIDLANTLKVYAPYAGNSIGIFWDDIPGALSYRLYRRIEGGSEKYITTFGPAYFFDNGVVEFE